MLARLSPFAAVALIAAACGTAHAAPVFNSANGHYYDIVHTNPGVNWATANAQAGALTHLGMQGHLATITTAQENLFLTSTFGASGPNSLHFHWIGGVQPAGSPEPAGGWSWVTGEPFAFTNWWPGEPNNFGGNENRILFDHGVTANGKGWNDLNGASLASGYVVEFTPTPEPVSLIMFGSLALAGAGVAASRRRNRPAASIGV